MLITNLYTVSGEATPVGHHSSCSLWRHIRWNG